MDDGKVLMNEDQIYGGGIMCGHMKVVLNSVQKVDNMIPT